MNATTKRLRRATAAPGMPTFEQAVAVALARASESLVGLIEMRIVDDAWKDADVDVDFAVRLAHQQITQMQQTKFTQPGDFSTQWFMASSAVALAKKGFSRPDCIYARWLTGCMELFTQMNDMVDFCWHAGQHGEKAGAA